MQAIAEHSRIVRIPINKINELGKVNKAFASLEQEFEREPTPEELSMVLNSELQVVRDLMALNGRYVSLDAPLKVGEEGTYIDVLEDESAEAADESLRHHESLRIELERSLKVLSPRQADIVKKYYGMGTNQEMTLEEIGRQYDLTRERVRQIKDKAMQKLKATTQSQLLRDYLG